MADSPAPGAPSTRRALTPPLRRFLELFVLTGFAVAQPLLDVTGRSPETFLFYRVDGIQVVAFALVIVLVPPVLLFSAVSAVWLVSEGAGRVVHAVLAGGLVALVVVQAGKKVSELRGPLLVVAAVVVAIGALALFVRSEAARTFLTFLTPAPLAFALLFLLVSPTADLVRLSDGQASAADRRSSERPPIVMIVLDEFPLRSLLSSKGQIDERIFPNFARLAEQSHWYRNGTGVSSYTNYALPAMLTGRYPDAKLAPTYIQHPDNLFSLLAPEYRIRSFESITQLCNPSQCDETEPSRDPPGLTDLFTATWHVATSIAKPYDEAAPSSEQFVEPSVGLDQPAQPPPRARGFAGSGPSWEALGHNQPERFQLFFKGLRASDEPTMHFLHLLFPHAPWRYLPSGATYPYPAKLPGGGWGPDKWPVEVGHQRHLLQLVYTDRLIGDVIDRMESQGIWDSSLVVVTADHGQSFIPGTSGRALTVRPDHAGQIAWVPVLIKEPGQREGTTSDANWEHVDLLPTVADAVGMTVPFRVDGVSHLSGGRDRADKHFYNVPGERITFPGPPSFTSVLEGVTDTFVQGSQGRTGLYEIGERADWIGRTVASLTAAGAVTAGPPSPLTAQLAPEVDFGAVDPASGSVPALVWGTLTGPVNRGPVVIAINGTVGAVSEIWPLKGKPSFMAMTNDGLLRTGANDLALYEVVGGVSPQLRPMTLVAP